MKRSFYILAVIFLVAVLVFLFFWFRKDQIDNSPESLPLNIASDEVIAPVFMTEIEKSSYGLPVNSQVQVFNRDESGVIMSYKIIRSDDDIITNRKELQIR